LLDYLYQTCIIIITMGDITILNSKRHLISNLTKLSSIFSLLINITHFILFKFDIMITGFYLFGSSDQTNNGSEISDPDAVYCKCRKYSAFLKRLLPFICTNIYQQFRGDHCVKMVK
jgi:hypothetical protein